MAKMLRAKYTWQSIFNMNVLNMQKKINWPLQMYRCRGWVNPYPPGSAPRPLYGRVVGNGSADRNFELRAPHAPASDTTPTNDKQLIADDVRVAMRLGRGRCEQTVSWTRSVIGSGSTSVGRISLDVRTIIVTFYSVSWPNWRVLHIYIFVFVFNLSFLPVDIPAGLV